MARYTVTVCPGCGRKLGVNGVDIHRMASTRRQDSVAPLPSLGGPLKRRAPGTRPAAGVTEVPTRNVGG